jgi:hypothetical protein
MFTERDERGAIHTAPEPPALPSPAERRQRNREEVRSAILEAARAVMREPGAHAGPLPLFLFP